MNLTNKKKLETFFGDYGKGLREVQPMGPTSNGQRGTRTRLQDRGGRSAYPGTRYWTRMDRVALLPSSHRAPRQLRTALVIKKDRWKKYISIY